LSQKIKISNNMKDMNDIDLTNGETTTATNSNRLDDEGRVVVADVEIDEDSSSEIKEVDLEKGENEAGGAAYAKVLTERTKPFIVLVACCAALGGLIFGYDIAGAGATFVMTPFQRHFNWKCAPDAGPTCQPASQSTIDKDKGFINGLFGTGATIGAFLNPYVAERYGRRICLTTSTCVFIVGAAIQAAAPLMWVMWLGRVFSGMGVGMLSMCVPVYITECSPEHVRGLLGTLWQIAVTAGILIASAANLGLKNWEQGWRLSYGGNIFFALLLLVCLMFMPESPRWLAAHGTPEQLDEALRKVRFDDEIERETQKLVTEVQEEKKLGSAPWKEVLSHKNNMRRRILLGMSFQAFQQLCGINAIMFYAPDILNTFFTESQAIAGTFGLNAINFLATFITVATVDKYGRVKLLCLGGVIMFLSLLANGILSAMDQTRTIGYIVLTFAAIFIIGFAFSWGPVVWIVCSEMFPYRTRGKGTGLTTMTNWAATTIIGALFPKASTASLSGCFFFFAVAITIGTIIVYLFQPETAYKTSVQIDEAYDKHKPKLVRKKN
jgi:sugar porter (SP) family MFS transporter